MIGLSLKGGYRRSSCTLGDDKRATTKVQNGLVFSFYSLLFSFILFYSLEKVLGEKCENVWKRVKKCRNDFDLSFSLIMSHERKFISECWAYQSSNDLCLQHLVMAKLFEGPVELPQMLRGGAKENSHSLGSYSVPLPTIQSEAWPIHEQVREPHLNPPVRMHFRPLALTLKGKARKIHTNRGVQMWFANLLVNQPCFRLDCRERY